MCKKFTRIEFKHIPRIQNEYSFHVDDDLDGKSWYYNIKRFLRTREYAESATNGEKRPLKRLANHFFLNAEVLYRRTPDLGLLRCVDVAEETRLLEEIHSGTCGPHMNGFTLSKKILRARYIWMTMESDRIRYMKKCH
ncbi:uncharacterized protein [Nicotiana tomentosiformis]|uniref:uncharacterized protein n=1 Tax=Nicotiana tomentosiformis TaxID=4098 RepID=UPI00051BC581|nr:uncharacterized protein LOC104109959 [Nicotiana tomentosiformis]